MSCGNWNFFYPIIRLPKYVSTVHSTSHGRNSTLTTGKFYYICCVKNGTGVMVAKSSIL